MEIGKESLYGWGVCQVPMPRAQNDIYADRRNAQETVDFPDRRTSRILRPFAAIFAAVMREDFPAMHTVLVGLAAVLLLLIFGLYTQPDSPVVEPPVAEPIEIVTRMLKEPVVEPIVPVEPVIVKKQPEPLPVKEQVVEQPEPIVKPVQVKPKKVLALPPAKVVPKPSKVPKKVVLPVEKPLPMPKKTVTLAVPERKTPVLAPAPSRQVQKYTVSSPQPRLVTDSSALRKRNQENIVVTPKASAAIDYSLKPSASGQQALARDKRFAPTAPGTTVDLPSNSGSRSDFSMPRSQGGHAVAQAGRSFAPQPGQSPVDIAAVGQVGGSYATPSSSTAAPLTTDTVGDFSGPAATGSVQLPTASRRGVAAVSSSVESSVGSGPPDSSVNFVGDGETGSDPNLFISLNQLGACVDQSEEDRLRTELAIRLDDGGIFPCGEMKFHIDYVETGQTVQMRIYNPRDFADKCAALLSAIECINHSK